MDITINSHKKKQKIIKNLCPCGNSSEGKDWLLVCCDCKQNWHASCCNMKGANKVSQESLDCILKLWQCPWCYVVPFKRPSRHQSFINESSLLEKTMSCSIIQEITESIRESMKETTVDISGLEAKLENLQKEVQSFKSEISTATVQLPPVPFTVSLDRPPPTTQRALKCPETPFEKYQDNFLPDDELQSLGDLLGYLKSSGDFIDEAGHSVYLYGEPYAYNGSRFNRRPDSIPPELDKVIDRLTSDLSLKHRPNSVLINYFPSCSRLYPQESHLARHSDNEPSIIADSKIITISVGASRKITFEPLHDPKKEEVELTLRSNSMYVMTRSSQNWFRHGIPPPDGEDTEDRFSITFRSLKVKTKREILLMGDSNTREIHFGSGIGKVGSSYPGKRVKAAKVRNIDPNACIGHSDIFLMCGTNDLRCEYIKSESDIHCLVDQLKEKLYEIKQLCPKSKIFVVPVLPSRISQMNQNIECYNMLVNDMLLSRFPDIWYEGIYGFLDNQNKLSLRLTRLNDDIHLGAGGLSKLVKYIKTCVYSREKYEMYLCQESTPTVGSVEPT